MAKSQPKRRVPKWLVVLSFGVLGCVLALLLTLLYFLYWLQAPVPLPDAGKLVLADADFHVVCKPDLSRQATRDWMEGCLTSLLRRAPTVARKLAVYALNPERASHTPMQFVLSGACENGRLNRWVGALSCGRYRLAFRIADRDLYRRAKNGTIPFGLRKHRDTRFYEMTRSAKGGPPVMGLWQATALASAELSDLRNVYDRLRLTDPPDGSDGSPGIAPPDLAVPEGKLGVLVVRQPDRVLPVLAQWSGESVSDLQVAVAGAPEIVANLRIDEELLLHVEAKASGLDGEAGERFAATLRKILHPLEDRPAVEALDLTTSGKDIEVYIRWRAPWTEPN